MLGKKIYLFLFFSAANHKGGRLERKTREEAFVFPRTKGEGEEKEKKKKNNHLRPMQINHKEPDEAVIPSQSETETTVDIVTSKSWRKQISVPY